MDSCSTPAATLGLVSGPAFLADGIAVMFGSIEVGSTVQAIATVPEFLWELSLGIWLVVKGFDRAALKMLDQTQMRQGLSKANFEG